MPIDQTGGSVLTLSAQTDRPLVAIEASSERIVEWTIIAQAPARTTDRVPLNLALVLDRSGSMAGAKLRYAQQAACHLLDQLTQHDRVAVVAYDDEVRLVAPSQALDEQARRRIKGEIDALRPGGSTDLSGGWLRGCQEIAAYQHSLGINRALLLSDGLANRGITDAEVLAQHACELRRRGVTTSTFGVGLDFNEHLMAALAEQGGGHFFFIERPEQIPNVFRDELGELQAIVAREAFLTLPIPNGVTIELLGDVPHERSGGRLRVFLGDVGAGEQRRIYARVLTPPDTQGSLAVLRAELGYADGDGRAHMTTTETAFRYAPETQVQMTMPDRDLRERASAVEVAVAATRALQLERQGQRAAAQGLMQQTLAAHAPYMPAPVAATYHMLADQMQDGLSEEQRKTTHFTAYKRRTGRG